jgi:hypothetical protein
VRWLVRSPDTFSDRCSTSINGVCRLFFNKSEIKIYRNDMWKCSLDTAKTSALWASYSSALASLGAPTDSLSKACSASTGSLDPHSALPHSEMCALPIVVQAGNLTPSGALSPSWLLRQAAAAAVTNRLRVYLAHWCVSTASSRL